MPTSVHLPKPLLEQVDRKARALHISRNQLVVRALEREIASPGDWSPEFLTRIAEPEPGLNEAVDDMLSAVRRARRSKKSVAL